MLNESHNRKRNPYDSLRTVATFTHTTEDVHALDVSRLPVPDDAAQAYAAFVMLGDALARATLVATAETRGDQS